MFADFLAVIDHSWDQDHKKKWYGTCADKPDGVWDKIAKEMMIEFSEAAHPIFRASSAIDRGEFRSKEGSKTTEVNKTLN